MASVHSFSDPLRSAATATGTSIPRLLVRLLRGPLRASGSARPRHTLLAVCPNSDAVARAALAAAQEAGTPLLFAATLNQIDRDGGYTGWTPAAFADFVAAEADRIDLEVPVILGLDHGGPWKKDAHARRDVDYDTTMQAVKRSITACVRAGYDLLHLDATADPRGAPDAPVPTDTLVDRTVELMRHAEEGRRALDRRPLGYEVGTEETGGGTETPDRVRSFLGQLGEALRIHDLPSPSFVVGDVGTTLDSPAVDTDRARQLVEIALDEMGALLKGHYTDDVATPEAYPVCGVGGANVGPGLAAVELDALRQLVGLERRLGHDSGLFDAVRRAVVESGRWRKWLPDDAVEGDFDALSEDRRRWLIGTGSRYVWTDPAVEEARMKLYENVSRYRTPDAYVHWRLKTAILEYMHAFNLIGLAEEIEAALADGDTP